MKILLSEAEKWVKPGRSKIYEDARKGVISTEKDPCRSNKRVVDTAELERVYGSLKNPEESEMDENVSVQIKPSVVIGLLENQVDDLKSQLSLANEREQLLIAEKTKLLDMLSNEQERSLMLSPRAASPIERISLWQRLFNRVKSPAVKITL